MKGKAIPMDMVEKLSNCDEAIWRKKVFGPIWDRSGIDPDDANELLCKFKKIIDKLGIKYWLTYGTALGFYRDGDFIPWDDDIDSHLDAHQMLEVGLEKIKKEFMAEGIVVRCKDRGLNSKFSLFYKAVKMQMQGVYEENDTMHTKLFHYPAKFYKNRQQFEYRGNMYFLPGPPDEYLAFCYDENWREPKDIKNWQDYMNPAQLKDSTWRAEYNLHSRGVLKKGE